MAKTTKAKKEEYGAHELLLDMLAFLRIATKRPQCTPEKVTETLAHDLAGYEQRRDEPGYAPRVKDLRYQVPMFSE